MRAALAVLALLAVPSAVRAQEWRATARFGRVTYESTPAGASANSSAVLGVARTGARDWLGASAALPLGEDPFWASLGGWQRLETPPGAAGLLLDLAGHGFIQRQRTATVAGPAPAPGPLPLPTEPPAPTRTDRSGQGIGGEVMAGAYAGSGRLRIEARGGVAAQRSELGNTRQARALPTGDARLSVLLYPIAIRVESRGWLDEGATRAYVGTTIQYARGPLRLWGSFGGWPAGGIDRLSWSAGAGTGLVPGVELELGGRGPAFDPLYLSSTATSLWAGLSLRLAGSRAPAAPVPARDRDGQAVIGLPVRAAPGAPSIAGDFTGWTPVPMRRHGSRWVWKGTLAPGVYHYAFVTADGTWFVPESVPGRQDDGMGGHVAVLVVP